jgi:hypothetical protein
VWVVGVRGKVRKRRVKNKERQGVNMVARVR